MKLLNGIVYSNLLISFSAFAVAFGFAQLIYLDKPLLLGLCVGFATLFIYGVQRLFRLKDLSLSKNERHQWLIRNRNLITYLSGVSGTVAGVIYFLCFFERTSFAGLTLVGVISLLYAARIGTMLPLREVPYIKLFLIALSWTAVCFLWPMILTETLQTHAVFLLSPLMYFLSVIIPFDIRDLKYDLPSQQTIPQLLGVRTAVILALSLLICSYLIGTYWLPVYFSPLMILAYWIQALFILYSIKPRSEYYYSLGIDGGIALFGIAFLVGA